MWPTNKVELMIREANFFLVHIQKKVFVRPRESQGTHKL